MAGDRNEDLALLLGSAAAMDHKAQKRWNTVAKMQRRTDRPAFEAARSLARSGHVDEQVLGLDILGQI